MPFLHRPLLSALSQFGFTRVTQVLLYTLLANFSENQWKNSKGSLSRFEENAGGRSDEQVPQLPPPDDSQIKQREKPKHPKPKQKQKPKQPSTKEAPKNRVFYVASFLYHFSIPIENIFY